jgi:hypothetical protein
MPSRRHGPLQGQVEGGGGGDAHGRLVWWRRGAYRGLMHLGLQVKECRSIRGTPSSVHCSMDNPPSKAVAEPHASVSKAGTSRHACSVSCTIH